MLQVAAYSLEELLRERREGSVRAVIRAIGYSLARGGNAEDLGLFLFDSYRQSGELKEHAARDGKNGGRAFAAWQAALRWGWCDDVRVTTNADGYVIESAPMLARQESVLGFHGVTRLDVELCMERFWEQIGREMGLAVTYTIGDEHDWAVVRPADGACNASELGLKGAEVEAVGAMPGELAALRRRQLATGLIAAIGFAKHKGDEPEDLGHFFYSVWERSGHYDRQRERWGYGNALAYALSIVRSRQVLYSHTDLTEDLDGYTIASPNWATEIPQVMGTFGVLPDDVHRYYAGGGIPACNRLGLQYADQSDDRVHRVWIRSR